MATTLQALRQALALALEDLEVHVVTTATASTMAVASLINATSGASPSRYDQRGAYISAGTGVGQQRRVRTGGYAPSTGVLTVYYDWTITPLIGATLELTRLFPCVKTPPGEETDYLTIVNRALGKMLYPDRLTLAITTAESYPLTTYAHWLNRQSRLSRVLEPAPTGTRLVPSDWRNPRLVNDGGTIALEVDQPFLAASGNLTLEVLRPANTLISGAESTVGFLSDAQTALPSVDEFLPFGVMEATALLMHRPDQIGTDWATPHAEATAAALASPFWDWTSRREAPAAETVAA